MALPPPTQQQVPVDAQRYINTLHNVALAAVIACPVLILIPPRKLDLYTWGLIGATAYSGNFLVKERTGTSIWQRVSGEPVAAAPAMSLPATQTLPKAVTTHLEVEGRDRTTPVTAELQSQREAWKAQREKEIQDDLDVGKGFGDMIMDQIYEVWNWGKKRDDEDED